VTSQAGDTASATLRAHAMIVAATAVVASIRRRQRDFLADPRSVLDCPVLADTTDPVVAALVAAYDEAVETLGECTPRHPRCAARALCAAHAAEYAVSLADQRAHRSARRGIYPPLHAPLDVRGWNSLRKLAALWNSPRTPGQRRRRRGTATARPGSPRSWVSGYLTCSPRPGKRCLTSPRR